MVPTYAAKGSRRYAYYETRKDLARPSDPPSTRWARARLEGHIIAHLTELMEDEHALRRMSGIKDAAKLHKVFKSAHELASGLARIERRQSTVGKLVISMLLRDDGIDVQLNPQALAFESKSQLNWSIPLPARKPFREAKLRIDAEAKHPPAEQRVVQLLVAAMDAQALVLASPELSLNQLGKREGRCRTQLAKLLRLSWLSPRIIEAILSGTQPPRLNRAQLLNCDLPIGWGDQERLLGFSR